MALLSMFAGLMALSALTLLSLPLVTGRQVNFEAEAWFRWFGYNTVGFVQLMALAWGTVVVHELGHALVAKLVGFRVLRLRVGTGPALPIWVRGVEVKLGVVPFGGTTLAPCRREAGYRWKRSAMCAAGLLGETVTVVAVVASGLMPRFAPALVIMLVLSWVSNLWPRRVEGSMGTMYTDGRNIAIALRADPDSIRQEIAGGSALAATDLLRRGEVEQALAELESAAPAGSGPDPGHFKALRAAALLRQGQVATAHAVFRQLHDHPERDPVSRAMDANNLAWCTLLLRRDQGLAQSLSLSADASDALGWMAPIQSTRGLALALAGETSDGVRLIRRALRGVTDRFQRAEVLCSLAIAEARRREPGLARRALNGARASHAQCTMLEWAEAEVEAVEQALADHGRPRLAA